MVTCASKEMEIARSAGGVMNAIAMMPAGIVRATVILLHAFPKPETHDAAKIFSEEMAKLGLLTVRIFCGATKRDSEPRTETSINAQIELIITVAEYLTANHSSPQLLIGHSVCGVAVFNASQHLSSLRALVTISAPADPSQIGHLLKISQNHQRPHENRVSIAEEESVRRALLDIQLRHLACPYLIVHAGSDSIIEFNETLELFLSAKQPKSLMTLGDADHFLSSRNDIISAARLIEAWSHGYLKNSY